MGFPGYFLIYCFPHPRKRCLETLDIFTIIGDLVSIHKNHLIFTKLFSFTLLHRLKMLCYNSGLNFKRDSYFIARECEMFEDNAVFRKALARISNKNSEY